MRLRVALVACLACLASPSPGASRPTEPALVAEAIGRHELFATLSNDQPGFRDDWEQRLRQRLPLVSATEAPDATLRLGLELAMVASRSYLVRASDEAANRFLGSLEVVVAEGSRDPEVCRAYVDADEAGGDPRLRDRVEARLGARLAGELLASLSAVVASGRQGEKRVLDREELRAALQPVVLAMVEQGGPAALDDLALVNARDVEPARRCQALARMLEAFSGQPPERRAMLARSLFSASPAASR